MGMHWNEEVCVGPPAAPRLLSMLLRLLQLMLTFLAPRLLAMLLPRLLAMPRVPSVPTRRRHGQQPVHAKEKWIAAGLSPLLSRTIIYDASQENAKKI